MLGHQPQPRPIRLTALWLVFSLVGAVLAGCSPAAPAAPPAGQPTTGPVVGGTLTLAVSSGVSSLNPIQIGTGIPDQFFVQPAYDSLLMRMPNGDIVPQLATAWKYANDNKDFTLTLRDGVKFSNGEPLNADAVKTWLDWWKGSTGLFASRFANVTVTVDGPQTVTLHSTVSDAAWPQSFTQDRYGFVICPKSVATPDTLGTATCGTGPYVLDGANTVSGTKYTYNANPDYWNKPNTHWQKIVIQVIADPTARLSALQSGQVDVATGDPQTAAAAKTAGLTVVHAPYTWNSLILFDRNGQIVPALGKAEVRQALNYAVDRTALTQAVFGEYGTPNVSMLVPGIPGHTAELEQRYTYDPAKAKALLAQAGYADGFTLPVATWNRSGLENRMSQALTSYYDAIGVHLDLKVYSDPGALLGEFQKKTVPAFTFFGQTEAPNLLVQEQLRPEAGVLNPMQINDQTLMDLYNKFHAEPSADAQTGLLTQMQARINDQAVYVTYSVSDEVYLNRKTVTGVDVSGAEPILNMYTIRPA